MMTSRSRRSYRLRDRALLVTGLGLVFGILMHLANQLDGPNAEPPALDGGLLLQVVGAVAFMWLVWGLIELMAYMDRRAVDRSRERYGERLVRESKSPEQTAKGLRVIQGGRR